MLDENAFGLLVAHFDLENLEYSVEPSEFAAHLTRMREVFTRYLGEHPLGDPVRVLDLGHALYAEVADGDQEKNPLFWLRDLRERLRQAELPIIAVLGYGSRWMDEPRDEADGATTRTLAAVVWQPSEPLRKALAVEAHAQPNLMASEARGWGAGYYVDEEAIEALGKKLKNIPTPCLVPGGRFFRWQS